MLNSHIAKIDEVHPEKPAVVGIRGSAAPILPLPKIPLPDIWLAEKRAAQDNNGPDIWLVEKRAAQQSDGEKSGL